MAFWKKDEHGSNDEPLVVVGRPAAAGSAALPSPAARPRTALAEGFFDDVLSVGSPDGPRATTGIHNAKQASPAPAPAPARPALLPTRLDTGSCIERVEDLPEWSRKIELDKDDERYAALLQDAKGSALLCILADDAKKPAARSLHLSMRRQFQRLQVLEVSAEVLAVLHRAHASSRKAEATRGTELNVQLGYDLIKRAIDLDASDIHIEIRDKGRNAPLVYIRMRTNGSLIDISRKVSEADVEEMNEIVRGLYQNDAICDPGTRTSTTFNASIKQEGMLRPPVRNAEVRFESLPEKDGYDVILRINGYEGKGGARTSLVELGLSNEQERDLVRAGLAPHGLIVVVGATGSGKTTSVSTLLNMDSQAKYKKRLSLEMPPESEIPYLSQLTVTSDTIIPMMNGVMRADPDVISGGEVRDVETAAMVQDFAITGHLAFATVHANGIFIALKRFLSPRLAMDPDLLAMRGFLRAVLYQSLVEKLCPACKVPARSVLDKDERDLLENHIGLPLDNAFARHMHVGNGEPCKVCRGTGVKGRTAIAELLVPTSKILALVREGDLGGAELEYRRMRNCALHEAGTQGKLAIEHAFYKAVVGEICTKNLFNLENLWMYERVRVAADDHASMHSHEPPRAPRAMQATGHGADLKVVVA